MRIVAAAVLLLALLAWLAPTIRAFRNGKVKLGLIGLASGPLAVGLYLLDRHPNVAMGVFVALMIGGSVIWRLARK